MWLLSTGIYGKPILRQFLEGANRPQYAILSHTWYENEEEVSHADIRNDRINRRTSGWTKITQARRQAADHGLEYIWIDTCCIDKTSSAELSEAINSMFRWYQDAALCMVYLTDLVATVNHGLAYIELLGQCRWFTRGWTLQEMLAPMPYNVHFFDQEWNFVGLLDELADEIASITGVHTDALQSTAPRQVALAAYSVAQKMSWAATRQTRRVEDRAYCLLGLFEVNLPIIYGEGTSSFFRLQESILKAHPDDHTILLWERQDDFLQNNLLLAPSPECFSTCHDLISVPSFPGTCEAGRQIEVISNGIRLYAPVVEAPKNYCAELIKPCVAFLRCQTLNDNNFRAYALELVPHGGPQQFLVQRSHIVDGYIPVRYERRARPMSIYFSGKAPEPSRQLASQRRQDQTPFEISNVLLRWVGKTSHPIAIVHPGAAWHRASCSFKVDLTDDGQIFTGRARVQQTLFLYRSVFICFALRLKTGRTASLDCALKISFSERFASDTPLAEDILNGPWCRKTIIDAKSAPWYNRAGDKIGDFTLAQTTSRYNWDRILHARMVPSVIAGQNHLIIELSTQSSITKQSCIRLAHKLRYLPGFLLDAATNLRSATPDELLEHADDVDRILMLNYQYESSDELQLAVQVGWYNKHDSNPRLWTDLRERRLGRLARDTWLGYTLKQPIDWQIGLVSLCLRAVLSCLTALCASPDIETMLTSFTNRRRFRPQSWDLNSIYIQMWYASNILSMLEYLLVAAPIMRPDMPYTLSMFFLVSLLVT